MTLSDKLRDHAASGPAAMHMPGHKRNLEKFPWLRDLGGALDITEIQGFDNLNDPVGLFLRMERRAAALWGAEESVALVNGSTLGVLAGVLAALEGGGGLLMSRDSHRSVYHAAELAGCDTAYLTPRRDPALGIPLSVGPSQVEAALNEHPNTRLVCITSPTYEGVISNVAAIARICRNRGVTLMVDAAHGAHLGLPGFPPGPAPLADITVMSLHKTLPSLTQTAMVHMNASPELRRRVRRYVGMLQSSSPSYLLSASIDGCVDYLERRGADAAGEWLEAISAFHAAARDLKSLKILRSPAGAWSMDPSKLLISAANADITGPCLAGRLREYSIEPEMSAPGYVLAMTGMGDTERSLMRLAEALAAIDAGLSPAAKPPISLPGLPRRAMSPRRALTSDQRPLPPESAAGGISAEYVWAYPPGSPILVPGEVIDGRMAELLGSGGPLRSTRGGLPERIFCARNY